MSLLEEKKRIVIIGVVGCCIAYYITPTKIAGGASGKAGGVIATWADPKCIAPLSHKLYTELAKSHDGEKSWGYRNVHCADVDAMGEAVGQATTEQTGSHFHSHNVSEHWVVPESIKSYTELGNPTNTAQVHPYLFTTKLAQLAEEQGTEIVIGSAMSINYTQDGHVAKSVIYKVKDTSEVHELLPTDIVIAAGPWTNSLLPSAPIKESRNHSIAVRPSKSTSAYVLFPELHPKVAQKRIPPEIYSRPDGTIYSCGPSDTDVPLPETSDLVEFDAKVCDSIYNDISSISREIYDGEVLARQACYRPIAVGRSHNIGPLVGQTGIIGLWLATGHDSWGISNGPATGKIMSEMILEGEA
ncbi:MAG: hypothetical protein MMC33_007989 [Icmadophila ericetorum]|nr:hypothetical protein [Icmadophila ericetorum]